MKRILKDVALGIAVFLTTFFVGLKLHNYTISRTIYPTSVSDYANVTVMVTRLDGRSGGTGVVVSSSPDESKILTNAHVCEVVKNGGLVSSEAVTGAVSSYQVSKIHDLCLINTKVDFKVAASLANAPPQIYSTSIVSGHPLLFPTILNRGHFTHKMMITVLTGMKDCTEKDFKSDLAPYCLFFGGIPVFKNYEAQVISNLILPGNSGSGVYNEKSELSGLVFAGSSGLNYAFIVPYEYINYFLTEEVTMLEVQHPSQEVDLHSDKETSSLTTARDKCKNTSNIQDNIVLNFCNQLRSESITYYCKGDKNE